VESGAGNFRLPLEKLTTLRVDIAVPALAADEAKAKGTQNVTVRAELEGKPIGDVKLKVQLVSGGVPQ